MPLPKATYSDIISEYLIVGEGAGDASLVRNLCEQRGITGFQIEDAGGSTKLETYLAGLQGRKGFDALKLLIVVADCDDDPGESFASVMKQLKAAKVVYPEAPYTFAYRSNLGDLGTYVLMLPFNGNTATRGALESILLPSAVSHLSRHVACLDAWCACLEIDHLSSSHRDKVRLRSLIAAAHPEDPNIGLQYAINPSKNLIPLSHTCFDPLAEVIQMLPGNFLTFVESMRR
jgi:hypothetical protein